MENFVTRDSTAYCFDNLTLMEAYQKRRYAATPHIVVTVDRVDPNNKKATTVHRNIYFAESMQAAVALAATLTDVVEIRIAGKEEKEEFKRAIKNHQEIMALTRNWRAETSEAETHEAADSSDVPKLIGSVLGRLAQLADKAR
jgi:hypothetical protein